MKLIVSSLEEEAVNADYIKKFWVKREKKTYDTYFYVYADDVMLAKYEEAGEAIRALKELANALAISNEPLLYQMEDAI